MLFLTEHAAPGIPGTDGPETTLSSQETDVHQAHSDQYREHLLCAGQPLSCLVRKELAVLHHIEETRVLRS